MTPPTQYIKPIVLRYTNNEIPQGDIDGVNLIFLLANEFVPSTTKVYLNGNRLRLGVDYAEDAALAKLTFTSAPNIGDILTCDYTIWMPHIHPWV